MSDPSELLREALALPLEGRAALVDSLLASMDSETAGEDAPELWREEIRRRLQEIDNGTAQMIPWNDARRRLQARLNR